MILRRTPETQNSIGNAATVWVWAAMNPISYSATQALDNALVGRFANT